MIVKRARLTALTALGAILVIVVTAGASAGQNGLSLATTIGGKSMAGSSNGHPLPMSPGATEIDLRLTNAGTSPIVATTVRLSSTVLGLDFFAYETAVEIRVAPGATEDRRFTLDLSALKGQATGLLPATVSVLDAKRHSLATQQGTVDVHGSKHSVYAIFGLVLFLLTAVGLVEVILALSRHGLSSNRFARGFRFLLPGIGLGLVLVIGSSVFSVFAPRPSLWVPIVAVTALAMFAVGYLSPTPETDRDHDEPPLGEGGARADAMAGPAAAGARGAPATLPPRRAPGTLPPGSVPPS
ncbi:MAG: hypothetical protein V7605_621 [Acidimicrobiaceae bacterium]|jgi:hypothetical protein